LNGKVLKTLEFDKIVRKLAHHAATEPGKQLAEQVRPSNDIAEVKRRLKATDEACLVDRLKGGAPFGGIRDIRASLKRARIGGMLSAAELLDIADTIAGGRRLKRLLLGVHEQHPIASLAALAEQISEGREVEEKIRGCIDEQAQVMDKASPALSRIRHEIRTGEARVRDRLEQMIRTPHVQKMLQDQLITIRNERYVIPVKQEYRNHFGGIVHDQSASGATLFIEPDVIVSMNNKLRELRLQEEQEIEKILSALSAAVASETEALEKNADCLAELDFHFAKSGLAREMKAALPVMNDRGFIKLRKGRHPLIPAETVVPIDLELGNQYTTMIITGPNTGGKTVTLKTVGLLSLMAMAGLFIPAEEGSQLCVFDGVYADIGDEQSIEQNLSTFSSHMKNIIQILREMTPKSLILLDELGAGTDPAEGSALAISILEHIQRMGCRMIATTHYGELKAYAYERKGVINASMEFDIASLRPTYRLLVGVPGRSNAFAIAERLGLSRGIIEMAKDQLGEGEQRVESMIATLEQNRVTAEAEREKAEQERREAERLRKELALERERFDRQRDKLLAKAEQEAREIIAKARAEADQIISELRKLAMEERSSIKEHKLIEAKKRLDEAEPLSRETIPGSGGKGRSEPVRPGDEVRVISLGQKGRVVEMSGGEAIVQLGILKMKVAPDDLEKLPSASSEAHTITPVMPTVKRSRGENVRTELDLRGHNLEDAMLEVDRFLDESILANLNQVYIIHGKGTGVLRNGIAEYLRKHKHVGSFRLGNFQEGGSGVTVVELK